MYHLFYTIITYKFHIYITILYSNSRPAILYLNSHRAKFKQTSALVTGRLNPFNCKGYSKSEDPFAHATKGQSKSQKSPGLWDNSWSYTIYKAKHSADGGRCHCLPEDP